MIQRQPKRNRGIFLPVLHAILIVMIFSLAARAEESKPTADFTLSALNMYVWRGQQQTRDSVVIQPSMTVGYRGFSVNLWGNLDTDPYAPAGVTYSGNWTETDLTASYTKTFGILSAGLGYIYYNLSAPNAGSADPLDSQELYLTLGLDTILAPTLTVYREIDHYHQWYVLLSASHLFKLGDAAALKLAGSVSWLRSGDSATYPEIGDSLLSTGDKFNNLHDGVLSASLPWTPWKNVSITPAVSWIFPLSDDARNEMKFRSKNQQEDNFLVFGLSLGWAF